MNDFSTRSEFLSFRIYFSPNAAGVVREFYASPHTLALQSDYFRTVCFSQFKEGVGGHLFLPEDDPDQVLQVLNCIHPTANSLLAEIDRK